MNLYLMVEEFYITANGDNIQNCREKAYAVINNINWNDGFYRKILKLELPKFLKKI